MIFTTSHLADGISGCPKHVTVTLWKVWVFCNEKGEIICALIIKPCYNLQIAIWYDNVSYYNLILLKCMYKHVEIEPKSVKIDF